MVKFTSHKRFELWSARKTHKKEVITEGDLSLELILLMMMNYFPGW
jgi:hypothetical protein